MNLPFIIKRMFFVAVLTATSMAAHAEGLRLNLIATIDNGPAMERVTWRVYRSGTDSAVTEATNHSTHVTVPAGNYRVVATLTSNSGTVTRSRDVNVRASDSRVIIPMD